MKEDFLSKIFGFSIIHKLQKKNISIHKKNDDYLKLIFNSQIDLKNLIFIHSFVYLLSFAFSIEKQINYLQFFLSFFFFFFQS